jgi:hypothetical protein
MFTVRYQLNFHVLFKRISSVDRSFPISIISRMLHTHLRLNVILTRTTNSRRPENSKKQCCFENREKMNRKNLTFSYFEKLLRDKLRKIFIIIFKRFENFVAVM